MKPPGLASIVKADYGALLGAVLMALGGGAALVKAAHLALLGMPWWLPGLGLLGVPLLLLRVRSVRGIFARGVVVPGRVTAVWLEGDRGRVDFEYAFEGATYRCGAALHRTSAAERLREGADVEVLVDRARPQSALIPALFD